MAGLGDPSRRDRFSVELPAGNGTAYTTWRSQLQSPLFVLDSHEPLLMGAAFKLILITPKAFLQLMTPAARDCSIGSYDFCEEISTLCMHEDRKLHHPCVR